MGAQERRYSVHKKLVCQASDFFRAACTGEWKESKERLVKLPEIEPATFAVYICWIYTGEIDVATQTVDDQVQSIKYERAMTNDVYRGLLARLTCSFALGDMLQDVTFKNAIIDELVALYTGGRKTPPPSDAHALWKAVPQESGFTRVFVDIVAVGCNVASFNKDAVDYPEGFVQEIAKAGMRDRDMILFDRGPLKRPRCFYHDHEGGKGKTKCCPG